MLDALRYLRKFLDAGGVQTNVVNWASHYLYGTCPVVLARASQRGTVYNPPGHL